MEPDTTVAMTWKPAQLDSMRRKMDAFGIMELPTPYPAMTPREDGIVSTGGSDFHHVLEVEIDGRRKHFEWSDGLGDYRVPRDPDQWRRLYEFTRFLDGMIERHPARRALPQNHGAYL